MTKLTDTLESMIEGAPDDAALTLTVEFVRKLLSASQWQPIETAPKDYCTALVADSETVWLAWYSDHDGDWHDATQDDSNHDEVYPTHWMPLPDPPSEAI
jgi:hypothetical protein